MKVCFFGSYERYGFNLFLKKILELRGVTVTECQQDITNLSEFFIAHIKLIKKHRNQKYDILVIPWKGIITLPLAKLISRKPIVYFPFVSIYQTLVEDRRLYRKKSLQSFIFRLVDKLGCKFSDLVILDANEDINYFCNEFKLDRTKFRRLFPSIDEDIYKPFPIKKREKNFIVSHIGTFVPLHGVEKIIESAKLLRSYNDIEFILSGNGQTKPKMKKLANDYKLNNLKFEEIQETRKILEKSDVGLGIFGTNKKARSVIPFKLSIVLSSRLPLITANTPAVKEVGLKNNENCLLVDPDKPEDIAKAILKLKNDISFANKIATNGYRLFKENLSMERLGETFLQHLKDVITK